MNANDLLDYALGQLDGPAREQIEHALAADPAAARSADRLSRSLRLLVDDGETYDPPPGLAGRTTRFVAESARQRRNLLEFVPASVPFRWADVAVAAGILAAGLLTLLPAVQRSKETVAQAGCAYNLQQLGRALWLYGSQHHHYPFAAEGDPKAPTGAFAAMLHDGGALNDLKVLDCPCDGAGKAHAPLPDYPTLCRMQATDPERCKQVLGWDYAYNVGFRNPETGRVDPIAAVHLATVPLLADEPPHENYRRVLDGNSPNHGGRGQNVLYTDLHVGWHNTRRLGPQDDDMFLNDRDELAPGVRPLDAALLPCQTPFLGWSAVAP